MWCNHIQLYCPLCRVVHQKHPSTTFQRPWARQALGMVTFNLCAHSLINVQCTVENKLYCSANKN